MKQILVALIFCAVCSADSIIGVRYLGPASGVHNGVYYVGPYNLLVDGTAEAGVCVTWNIHVANEWQATPQMISNYSGSQRTALLKAIWLSQQFTEGQDWASIHQAIWNLFGAAYSGAATSAWIDLAERNWTSVDATRFILLDAKGASQNFIVKRTPAEVGIAEPGTCLLLASGVTALVLRRRRRNA